MAMKDLQAEASHTEVGVGTGDKPEQAFGGDKSELDRLGQVGMELKVQYGTG